MKKAFTLIELLVAIGLLAMILSFASVIFSVSVDSYRTASANADIMQKLRVITEQLNADFQGLQKDGYLILYCELQNNREEYPNSDRRDFQADRLYYLCTGDFQSWSDPNVKSNIARVYFGHDSNSLYETDKPVSHWKLARDVRLLTPKITNPPSDCNNVSYSEFRADWQSFEDPNEPIKLPVSINSLSIPPTNLGSLMSQNTGEIKIEWTYDSIDWFGFGCLHNGEYPHEEFSDVKEPLKYYWVSWRPDTPQQYWPKALKFTFTLYDSRAIMKGGRTFTHIVYLDD